MSDSRGGDAVGGDDAAHEGDDAPSTDAAGPPGGEGESAADRREVAVPLRVYKAVTVVSTLVSLLAVVAGLVLLDAATDRGRAPPSEVAVPVALAGLAAVAAGAVVYAYGTRFRAPDAGTGSVNDRSDESHPDG